MIPGIRKRALACMLVAVLIGAALAACSASTDPAPSVRTTDSATGPSSTADTASAIPEIVITATRLTSQRVASATGASTRPSAIADSQEQSPALNPSDPLSGQ